MSTEKKISSLVPTESISKYRSAHTENSIATMLDDLLEDLNSMDNSIDSIDTKQNEKNYRFIGTDNSVAYLKDKHKFSNTLATAKKMSSLSGYVSGYSKVPKSKLSIRSKKF